MFTWPRASVYRFDLALLFNHFAFGQLEAPGKASQVADQDSGPLGAQPGAAIALVVAVFV